MVKLSSNPTCVLSDADVITNEQAERIAKVLTKHLPGANNVTEAGKILGVNAEGDVALVEDKTGSTYTAGTGLTLTDGEFSVDNPLPGASGASQGDVLTVGSSGIEWAAPSGGGGSGSGLVTVEPGVTTLEELFSIINAGNIPSYIGNDGYGVYYRFTPSKWDAVGVFFTASYLDHSRSTSLVVLEQQVIPGNGGSTTWTQVNTYTVTMS